MSVAVLWWQKTEECGNGELQAKLHAPAAGKSTCAAMAQNTLNS